MALGRAPGHSALRKTTCRGTGSDLVAFGVERSRHRSHDQQARPASRPDELTPQRLARPAAASKRHRASSRTVRSSGLSAVASTSAKSKLTTLVSLAAM